MDEAEKILEEEIAYRATSVANAMTLIEQRKSEIKSYESEIARLLDQQKVLNKALETLRLVNT